jgi:hypothetical protein
MTGSTGRRPTPSPDRPAGASPTLPHGATVRRANGMPGTRLLWARFRDRTDVAERLRPLVPQVVRVAVNEIQRSVPEYADPLEGKFRDALVGAVETSITQFLDNILDPKASQEKWERTFREAGRIEYLEGRGLDALQAAVRIGSRSVWRVVNLVERQLGVQPSRLFALADAIFANNNEICAVALKGYLEAQAQHTGVTERRRRQLMKLILADPPTPMPKIMELAGTIGWTVPEHLAVVVLEYREDQHQLPASALDRRVLVDLESDQPCLITADPETDLRGLSDELHGRRSAIGPKVRVAEAHQSLAVAARALRLVQHGVLPPTQITWCHDHLSTLALLSDTFLVRRLTRRAMAPFAALTPKQRDRLATTLLAWLDTRAGINEVAARLAVHPQTVRYRMRRIDELLGEKLSDPNERFTLEIALRAHHLLSTLDSREQAAAVREGA